ncbi:ABC transporter substrate-binding protein [Pseudomonas sp. PA15(2017)]|uniref:DUF2076 domain-containing protein n=1 Tax=Pseudomonas sp. PA15(2017) TaxID=1932111 RepID=UPI0009687C81|nr:DUF2076 domain-containing protein [Pseudomonas sp. PA15(2017)]OLU26272.1 ABC transporter substrate-binding protein [Pseudomonas sp. PA15(2017)]
MNSEEQTLIDGLFTRLQEAEHEGGLRDSEAEAQIKSHLARQPAAPYYMAQALLIQEAAIKRLDQRVRELEAQAADAQRQRAGGGGFLSGLFGGGQTAGTPQPSQRPAGWGETRFSQNANVAPVAPTGMPGAAPAAQGGGFMRGALQTAAGVAGGVMVADLLTNMFHHDQPQEIVEVIRDEAPVQDSFANGLDDATYAGNSDMSNDIDTDAFDSSDFFDDDSMFS